MLGTPFLPKRLCSHFVFWIREGLNKAGKSQAKCVKVKENAQQRGISVENIPVIYIPGYAKGAKPLYGSERAARFCKHIQICADKEHVPPYYVSAQSQAEIRWDTRIALPNGKWRKYLKIKDFPSFSKLHKVKAENYKLFPWESHMPWDVR